MKTILSFLLIFSPFFLLGQICGMPLGEEEQHCTFIAFTTFDDCDNPCVCHLVESNEHYIPDEQSPILNIKINLHVIAHELDPVTFPNFVEGNEDHLNYLRINMDRMEEEIYAGVWNNALIEERCDDVLTGQFSIDSRIRFTVNENIEWHYGTFQDYSNDNTICGSHTYEQFIEPFPNLYDDALDILFVENNTGNGGCGQALGGEATDFILINNAFTARYVAGEDWHEKGNLAHEVGHALGLFHPEDLNCVRDNMGYGCVVHDAGGAFTGDFNQVMHGNSSNQRFFTELEVAQMRRYLLTTWRKKWLSEIPQEVETIAINGNEIWDESITWIGDIVVPANSQLTINNTLRMQEDRMIFVERGGRLIIDEGTITSCNDQWGGIRVEGAPLKTGLNGQLNDPFDPTTASFAGTVILINEGTIDNAKNGISTNNFHLEQSGLFNGGLIFSDEGRFTNCDRAVEFFPYGSPSVLDKSIFNNTVFEDCGVGVTNWASDGVTFTQCSFTNIEGSATGGYNAAINVYDGNVFENVVYGVDLVGTRINQLASVIGTDGTDPNIFNGFYGIYSSSVKNLNPTTITNNIFDGIVGVVMEGVNNFQCFANDFEEEWYGVYAYDTDDNNNVIRNNSFSSNDNPIAAVADNAQLTFSDNCMELSSNRDIRIHGEFNNPGRVNFVQGSDEIASGNIFSKFNIPEIQTTGTTQSFNYFVQEDELSGSGYYPDANGNFAIVLSETVEQEDCGTGNFQGPPTGESCTPSTAINVLIGEIQTLDTEIAYFKNQQGGEKAVNDRERCLSHSLATLGKIYLEANQETNAINYFSQRPEFIQRTFPYSIYMEKEEYLNAGNYLNGLAASNFEETNYKMAQNTYLDYLKSENYVLSAVDSLNLLTAGSQMGPLNGYSRSIFYIITGERITLPMPTAPEERKQLEDNLSEQTNSMARVYPNPSKDGIFIIEGISKDTKSEMRLVDVQGRIYTIDNLYSDNILDLSSFPKGMYFIQFIGSGNYKYDEKIIIY